MALNGISVTTDPYLLMSMDYLSRITGFKNPDDITAQALALTAESIQKNAAGYMIRILHQSVRQEWFDAPLRLSYLYLEMSRRAVPLYPGSLYLALGQNSLDHIQSIRNAFNMKSDDQAIHFALFYANKIAPSLRSTPGVCRLTYVDEGGHRPCILAQTPYDRTLRNEFNRLLLEFQDRLKGNKPYTPMPPYGPPRP